MIPISLILFLSLMHIPALADRPEHEPHPPRCDQGRVNACAEAHRVAGDQARLSAYSLDPELTAITRRIKELDAPMADLQNQLTIVVEERRILSSEISFVAKNPRPSVEMPSGFPTLENFFHLHLLKKNWLDRFPTERAQILTARLAEAKVEEIDLSSRYSKISSEFQGLNDQYQSLNGQKVRLLAEANQHVAMCNGGCLNEICPPREP